MNKFQWNSNQNTGLFIHVNEFETVFFEMAAILSREVELMGIRTPGAPFTNIVQL